MRVELYTTNSDRKQLRKDLDKKGETDSALIKEPCSIINPVITLSRARLGKAWAAVNYVYIPDFKRYYFIDNIVALNDGLVEISMHIDVLMTYADSLVDLQLEIVRAASLNSKLYIDPEMPLQANKLLSYKKIGVFPESVGENTNNYYLTVAGGN